MVHVGCMNNITTTTRICLFLLAPCFLFASITIAGQDDTFQSAGSAATQRLVLPPSLGNLSTCRPRTVNYITHGLPQQCRKVGTSDKEGAQTGDAAGLSGIPFASNLTQSTEQENGTSNTDTVGLVDNVSPGANSDLAKTTLPTQVEPDADLETDSPLDSINFLSFEDWKKENLAKAGQSPEHLDQQRASSGELRRRPVNIHALESLGDEAEIDIDFSNFGSGTVPGDKRRHEAGVSSPPAAGDRTSQSSNIAKPFRGKDAGTTCKERFNYASFDCAATILKTNPKCKSSTSILVESKDSYMINECKSDNKFAIVELCEDILIDTIVLANFEFFSSTFRTFRISVSDRYPVKGDKWKTLGMFEARNTREIQAFAIENPLIWARYMRIEFLTHYGNEYYCPVSLLRVHGTTMMEEFRHQDEAARGEDEIEESVQEAIPPPIISEDKQIDGAIAQSPEQILPNPSKSIDEPVIVVNSPTTLHSSQAISSTKIDEFSSAKSAPPESPASSSQHQQVQDASLLGNASAHVIIGTNDTSTGNHTTSVGDHISAIAARESTVNKESKPQAAGIEELKGSILPSAVSSAATSSTASQSQSQPPAPGPTTQDSFYKLVSKRLQTLESNSTLSVKYIEEQSRILRDAFTKTEKRQSNRTEKFLHQVNATVVGELLRIGQQYDQLFQSLIVQTEAFEERHQIDLEVVLNRLGAMNEELTWQKRVSVAQSSLLLFIFALIVFVRSGSTTSALGIELPLMQQMLNKSQSVLRLPLDSPLQSPGNRTPSPVTTRYKSKARPPTRSSEDTDLDQDHEPEHGHDQSPLINAKDGTFNRRASNNPRLHFSPATPTTETGSSLPSAWTIGTPMTTNATESINGIDDDESEDPTEEREEEEEEEEAEAEDGDADLDTPVLTRQTRSGPATPSGTREHLDPLGWDFDELTGSEGGQNAKMMKGRKVSPLRHVEEVGGGIPHGNGEDLVRTSEESGID